MTRTELVSAFLGGGWDRKQRDGAEGFVRCESPHLLHCRIRFCNVWWVHVEIRWSLLHARSSWAANLVAACHTCWQHSSLLLVLIFHTTNFVLGRRNIQLMCFVLVLLFTDRYGTKYIYYWLKYSVLLTSTWQYCTVDDEHEDEVPWPKNQSNANCKDNSNDWNLR